MLESTLHELRAEAKAAHVRWAHVAAAARELRALEIAKREPLDRARCLAWGSYCHWAGRSPSCLPSAEEFLPRALEWIMGMAEAKTQAMAEEF